MLLIFLVFYGVLFGMLQLRVIAIWFCLECCHYVYMQYALLHFQQRVSIFQHEFCSCLSSHDLQTIVFEKNAIRKKSESLKKISKKVKCKPTPKFFTLSIHSPDPLPVQQTTSSCLSISTHKNHQNFGTLGRYFRAQHYLLHFCYRPYKVCFA